MLAAAPSGKRANSNDVRLWARSAAPVAAEADVEQLDWSGSRELGAIMTAEEGKQDDDKTHVCVVIDTNQWVSSQLLRDPVSASLLYAISTTGGCIGLPEVIEREVLIHGVRTGATSREAVEKNLRTIRALVGRAPGVTLPRDDEFEAATRQRIRELDSLLCRTPFTTDIAFRALTRVDTKRPPAHAGQQFKDCAIWEACLDLGAKFEVHLVSNDKTAFFEGANTARGMEKRLIEDCIAAQVRIILHPSLESCLEALADHVQGFDKLPPLAAIEDEVISVVRDLADEHNLVIIERINGDLGAFVTEAPNTLALTFSLTFSATVRHGRPDAVAAAMVAGQARYDIGRAEVSDVKLDGVTFTVEGEDGEIAQHARQYVSATLHIGGSREEVHTIRAPLPGGAT